MRRGVRVLLVAAAVVVGIVLLAAAAVAVALAVEEVREARSLRAHRAAAGELELPAGETQRSDHAVAGNWKSPGETGYASARYALGRDPAALRDELVALLEAQGHDVIDTYDVSGHHSLSARRAGGGSISCSAYVERYTDPMFVALSCSLRLPA